MTFSTPYDTCLYLLPNCITDIKLDENSLTAWQNDLLVQRYPIRRIQFVCSNGLVNWQTNAIFALLMQGIAVHFIGDENQTLGKLLPSKAGDHPFQHWLERLLNHPRWQSLIDNYQSARKHRALKTMLNQQGAWLSSLRPYEVNRWIEEAYRKVDSRGRHQADYALFESLVTASIEQGLSMRSLDKQQPQWVNTGLDVAAIVMCGVSHDLHIALKQWYAQTPVHARQPSTLIQYINEYSESVLSRKLETELNRLTNWIKKTLD